MRARATSRCPPSRRLCCTRGRWRSRSSSTWCGRWWCSACSRSARHTGDPAARGSSDAAPASAPHDAPNDAPSRCSAEAGWFSGGRRPPGPIRHGSAAGGCTFSLRSPASVRWPPRCSWCCRPPTGTPAAPTTARTPGRRRCWSAPPSPSGWRSGAREAAARGSPARRRCSPSPVLPGPQCCGPRRRRPRRSPSVVGSCWPAWRRAGSSSAARWRRVRWWSASWNCRPCRKAVGSPTASISGTGPSSSS